MQILSKNKKRNKIHLPVLYFDLQCGQDRVKSQPTSLQDEYSTVNCILFHLFAISYNIIFLIRAVPI